MIAKEFEGAFSEGSADPLLVRLGTEVRATLHNFMGLLELVTSEPLSDNQAQYLSHSRASADQLLSFANDLLELAQAEHPVLHSAPFCVEAVVVEIATLMSVLAESRGFKFTWEFISEPASAMPAWVAGDQQLLQDTLRRLIAGAMDLAQGGEIHLRVSARPEGNLVFELTAPSENAGEELFSSSQPGTTMAESALSLSVVRKRANYLGGSLSTTARNGLAILRLTVPLPAVAPIASDETYAGSPDGGTHGAPLNLLVAEDSDDSFFLLQAFLANQGHRLTRATDGAQAVDSVKTGRFDFVVMDVKMPVMDGYTASRLIREWETEQGRPRLPILLLSADEPGRQMRIGASVGCSGYLTKPASRAQVLEALDFYSRPGVPPAAKGGAEKAK